ncbi:MAG: DUF4956 domain-containing protein [Butyricicoccus sp.]
MLNSILTAGTVTPSSLLLCTLASLMFGLLSAMLYMFRNTYTKGFVCTLVLLPAIVQMVIMLVNGNLGTGVAVMGAFSLIRFRSTPGGAREICAIFLAMALGLATGMGYLGIAAMMLALLGLAQILLTVTAFGECNAAEKELKITIPESLDYTGVFDDLFDTFTRSHELIRVRTTNMGSLYELLYHITLRDQAEEKAFIDALRCRNGNLGITCGRVPMDKEAL